MKKLLLLLACVVAMSVANRMDAQCPGNTPQCHIQVEMHDSYGDGWNSGQLYAYQGSTLRGTVTLQSGREGTALVPVCSDSISRIPIMNANVFLSQMLNSAS